MVTLPAPALEYCEVVAQFLARIQEMAIIWSEKSRLYFEETVVQSMRAALVFPMGSHRPQALVILPVVPG